jgi:LuxR family quorum sensing-dependent transcriptional regulator
MDRLQLELRARLQSRPNAGSELPHIQNPIHMGFQEGLAELPTQLIDYASRVDEMRSPDEVLDELHRITSSSLPISVLAAARFPLKSADWGTIRLGHSAFIHRDVPEGWWDDYNAFAGGRFRPMLFLARSSLASFTWTEVRRMLQPIGVDQWAYELALKYGMRDGLTCPVGGRWVVTFWSRKDLSSVLTPPIRILLVAAVNFAALRLEQLAGPDPDRLGARGRLTPREVAVLRLLSTGAQSQEVAQCLSIGEETVRSHLKKAQTKLGVRNRVHAVAEALRQNLIP